MSSPAQPTARDAESITGLPEELSGRITAHRGTPAPEVLEQIAAAEQIHQDLLDRGMQIRFQQRAGGQREILLSCGDGFASRELTHAETADIATGLLVL